MFTNLYEKWQRSALKFSKWLEIQFGILGTMVATYPLRTCLSVLGFVCLCVVGFMNFKMLSESEDLWIPPHSKSFVDEKYVTQFFGETPSYATTLLSRLNGNVITRESFNLLWKSYDVVVAVETDGLTFNGMCQYRNRETNGCIVSGPTQFWSNNKTLYDETIDSDQALIDAISAPFFPTGQRVDRKSLFGLFTTTADNKIDSAQGLSQSYSFHADYLDITADWELDFVDAMEGLYKSSPAEYGTSFHYLAGRSMDDELARSSQADTFTFVLSYLLMFSFTSVCISRHHNPVESRVGLSMCGIFCIVLGLAAGYGLCSGMGIEFNQLHLLLPFIVMGIGVDDLIIITFTFDQTSVSDPPVKRIQQTMEHCGVSIAYTTLTDIMAFSLGSTSSIPAIRAFCAYAALSLFFNFVFQITAYTSLLCMDANRMNNGRMDVLYCIHWTPKKDQSVHPIVNTSDEVKGEGDDEEEKTGRHIEMVPPKVDSITPCSQHGGVDNKDGDKELPVGDENKNQHRGAAIHVDEMTRGQYFFSEIYFPFINNIRVRIAIVIGFLAFFAVCINWTTQLDIGLDLIILVPDDSYVRKYISRAREVELFGMEFNLPVKLYIEDVAYHEKDTNENILALQQKFIEGEYNVDSMTSWVSTFNQWKLTSAYNSSLDNSGYFAEKHQYYEALEVFLEDPRYSFFADSLVFNYNQNETHKYIEDIRISYLSGYHKNQHTSHNRVAALLDTRKLCSEANLSPKAFSVSVSYKYTEIDIIILKELVWNLVLAVVAVGLISLIVLINPKAVLLVIVLIISVDMEVLGVMVFWDLTLNTVTLVQLVMAVGLVVDYMAHIVHHYSIQSSIDYPSNSEKLKVTMSEMAPSVFMGCFTTLLGVLPLSLASSTMFRMFFKMFLSIVVFGALHGFVLLPAILPWLNLETNTDHDSVIQEGGVVVKCKIGVGLIDECEEGGLCSKGKPIS